MKSIYGLSTNECRWPTAVDAKGRHLFCAEPWDDQGGPYCAQHHALSLPVGAEPRRVSPLFRPPRIAAPEVFEKRNRTAEIEAAQGCRPPKQTPTLNIGRQGKRVDEDGYEKADREPDLVEMFAGAQR